MPTVSPTTTSCSADARRRAMASPLSTGCVATAITSMAPASLMGIGSLHQRAGRVDHVVEDERVLAFDGADDIHDLGNVFLRAALVDDRQRRIEPVGEFPGAHQRCPYPARPPTRLSENLAPGHVRAEHRIATQMIHGDIEETLDLPAMEVDG